MKTIPSFRDRCSNEATRDAIFLFQSRRVVVHNLPPECEFDGDGIRKVDSEDGVYVTSDELLEREYAIVTWQTESVWLSREEAEDYGTNRSYNYPDGWRVYSVPSEGQLAALIRNTP